MATKNKRGFTIVELMVAAALSAIILAGVTSSFVMFVRSSIRISNYATMEAEATRALEMLARDLRMAQAIATDAPTGAAESRNIQQITLTVRNGSGVGTTSVVYSFDATAKTFKRVVGAVTTTLIRNVVPSTASFSAYNLNQALAANDYETNQIKISMTTSPDTKGNYATTTKRVISARFVLRNR